jgi:hypothetical protein
MNYTEKQLYHKLYDYHRKIESRMNYDMTLIGFIERIYRLRGVERGVYSPQECGWGGNVYYYTYEYTQKLLLSKEARKKLNIKAIVVSYMVFGVEI